MYIAPPSYLLEYLSESDRRLRQVNEDAGAVKMPEKLPTAEQTAALVRRRRSIFLKDFTGESVDRRTLSSTLTPPFTFSSCT